jgi:hypothetical protein
MRARPKRRENKAERISRTIGLILLIILAAVILAVFSDQIFPAIGG